jgi:GNAT superfamily N-acetyltransferase
MQIRKARLEDLDTLLQFEQGIVETERPFDSTLKAGEIHYYDLKALILSPEACVIVAEIDGQLTGAGYAQVRRADDFLSHTYFAYLGFMYVKPAHRGKGINKAILEELTKWAKAKNIVEIRLEVYAENDIAKTAYEKAGFKSHMLLMRKAIS